MLSKSDIRSYEYSGTTNNYGNIGISISNVPKTALIIDIIPSENSVIVSHGRGSSGGHILSYENASHAVIQSTEVSGTVYYLEP